MCLFVCFIAPHLLRRYCWLLFARKPPRTGGCNNSKINITKVQENAKKQTQTKSPQSHTHTHTQASKAKNTKRRTQTSAQKQTLKHTHTLSLSIFNSSSLVLSLTSKKTRRKREKEKRLMQSSQLIMILPQVHLRKPCYDFYFL